MGAAFLLALLCGAFFVPVLSAQDLRDLKPEPVAPQVAPPEGEIIPPAPAQVSPAPADETVMVEALLGLVFVTAADQVQPSPAIPEGGLDAGRVPLLADPEARAMLQERYLGKPVSMAALQRLVMDLYLHYSRTDTPFVSITLPEQDITSGVVQVMVRESRAGAIRIDGARYFSEDLYRSSMRLKPGDPVRKSVLNGDADWINRNPFRAGNFFMAPGGEPGTTDFEFRVNERLPLRVYAGYNNAGTDTTGKNRAETGLNWGNAFGLGHQLNYQFTTNTEFEDYAAHSGSYLVPLPWRDALTLSGVYSTIHSRMPEPFNQDGKSSELNLQYDHDLQACGAYTQGLSLLFDYKNSDNNMEFSDEPVTDNTTYIMQASLVYSGNLPDSLGATGFTGRLTYSPGDLGHYNKDEYFDITRAGAEADYTYANLRLTRSLTLPAAFSLDLSATGQLSNRNLLGSEQVQFSGQFGVRGYDDDAVYADTGYLLRAELLLPLIFPARMLADREWKDPFQPFLFCDYGMGENVDPLPDEDPTTIVRSAGAGCRYHIDRYLSVDFSYGWQLKSLEGEDRGSKGHIRVLLSS
ncbi:MAG: ShlB/FhaC/HecB family hemolysin secretion/activation protein [Thermodesulfobacteriota bacterium]